MFAATRQRRKGLPVDRQERARASPGHGMAAALREGALEARKVLKQLHLSFIFYALALLQTGDIVFEPHEETLTARKRRGRGLFKTGLKMLKSAMVVSGERVDLCAQAH